MRATERRNYRLLVGVSPECLDKLERMGKVFGRTPGEFAAMLLHMTVPRAPEIVCEVMNEALHDEKH